MPLVYPTLRPPQTAPASRQRLVTVRGDV